MRPNHAVKQDAILTQDSNCVIDWVRQAMDVTAPQWPLSVFVARHPWPHLERLAFADALTLLADIQDVHLFPSLSVIRSAVDHGDIALHRLEQRLCAWVDEHVAASLQSRLQPVFRALMWEDERESDVPEYVWALANEVVAGGEAPLHSYRVSLRGDTNEYTRARLAQQTIKWCKLYLDAGQAGWALPGRQEGFYRSWRHLIVRDPALTRAEKRRLADWPGDAGEAIALALQMLDVPEHEAVGYLRAHLAALPGWVGMLFWQGREEGREIDLVVDYVAVRLSLEWAFCEFRDCETSVQVDDGVTKRVAYSLAALHRHGGMTRSIWRNLPLSVRKDLLVIVDRFRRVDRWQLWLEAWEDTQAERIVGACQTQIPAAAKADVVAQLLFCIDVRSEPFRRNLETFGAFATYGCAGFFNLPIKTRSLDGSYAHPSCPAIVTPVVEVRERPMDDSDSTYRQNRNGVRFIGDVFKKVKQHVLASLALPELSGPWLGLYTFARTLAPSASGGLFKRWASKQFPDRTTLVMERVQDGDEVADIPVGLTVTQMAEIAGGLLRSIGLTEFAPLVVVCGHESSSANNAHAAALDCGACGGAAGRWNARVFAAICNRRDVRNVMATRFGVSIPEDTVFVAAEHVTTTDELVCIEMPELKGAAKEAWGLLQTAAKRAQWMTAAERMRLLPGVERVRNPVHSAIRRARDWSEVRPEWGLAGNRAFIIGRRALTQGWSWKGEVFLHSYDWQSDRDGSLLASIIAGPVTVAQWINLQYYASTVAPDVYGSGSKTTQTVTSGLGVMQGNGGDLLAGLPWQSVASGDRALFHAPLRLWVVIEAPDTAVEQLLATDRAFHRKVAGGWLRLGSIDPLTGCWRDWSGRPMCEHVEARGV
ncbi:UPF0753 protein YbcC [Alicyclobacillus hesperidum]|uniref:Probable inorganic carbon transporter subunit DabA n=1 Tax=Alicyclobacillus hesperidum TaxID=89784 RepID=A0A1H2XI67_9BACL|nr:DUF2309 domain-containing protein [Alicyclobacillus hesperidum]GLV14468.1 UPF0753 protein YbcC [Alicyclobacillus hesperidum]SDW92510.1 hypothetical protein SAMN04489725_1215 [Alicyclobacillus hesperidum]